MGQEDEIKLAIFSSSSISAMQRGNDEKTNIFLKFDVKCSRSMRLPHTVGCLKGFQVVSDVCFGRVLDSRCYVDTDQNENIRAAVMHLLIFPYVWSFRNVFFSFAENWTD